MKIFIKKIKENAANWEEAARNIFDSCKEKDIFYGCAYNAPYSDSPIIFGHIVGDGSEVNHAIYFSLKNRSFFIKGVKKIIKLGIVKIYEKRFYEENPQQCDCFVIEIDTSKLEFSVLKVETESRNHFLKYGVCKNLPFVEIHRSKKIVTNEWYDSFWNGNEYNGWPAYRYLGNAPDFELDEGYEFKHVSGGYRTGSYRGGSYIEKS